MAATLRRHWAASTETSASSVKAAGGISTRTTLTTWAFQAKRICASFQPAPHMFGSMSLSGYGAFLGFAIVLILIPGPDFAVVTKNTLAGGRRRGWFTAAGVCTSNAVQGAVAVSGLSAIILKAQPVFTAVKWAGVCYLGILGIQSLRSALRGEYELPGGAHDSQREAVFGGWR